MAELISFAALRVPPGLALNLRAARRPSDPEVRGLRDITGPEVPLAVEFVGISEAQQRAALAAFPGGKRFRLVSQQPEAQA